MARELSQGELLDFLCGAGGRASNAALLGHFKGFLRDAAAGPEELRRRRELFKGFVNSVATVKQEAAGGGAKFVVLRKRFRQLVGEEPPEPPDGTGPGRAHGGEAPPGPRTGESRPKSGPGEGWARPELEGPPGPRTPPSPPPIPSALLGGEARRQHNGPPGDAPANGPAWPVAGGGLQQRIRAWVAQAHEVSRRPDDDDDAAAFAEGACWPSPPASPPEPVPVFRSIRCQLALQDLQEFLEQESPASEEGSGSSSSGGSDSSGRGEGEQDPQRPSSSSSLRCPREPTGGAWTAGEGGPPGAPLPGRLALPAPFTQGCSKEDEPLGKDSGKPSGHLPKGRKGARWPSPNRDAPLSPQLAHREGFPNGAPSEGPGPDADASPEPRSSLVPLEPREHAWLVKVAAGSWLQARALFLEDPHLATRKDFISGYTVLHWLAKHGNAQVLLDFVTGARQAGVALDVDVKSGCGYTPLHLAAMHGHQLVIRLLVQKLRCQIRARDSSGKRPWQYLSSSTSGEIWQLLGAPKGKTIFPAHPIARNAFPAQRGKSPELARKISRKTSLAAYLKPQHIKWKMANKYPALQEREAYSD
ncbi:ankyrin repeat domain-containing protein SOWAHB [Paroedura picta]|uniref:ankyrin repeat domain-containing protein SOWAHB n=1 Tax=Paroedura picta TaxID=143630 RepID=UPI004055E8D7